MNFPADEPLVILPPPHPQAMLTARVYFAAHAPAVPDWFKYQSEENPPFVPSPDCLSVEQRREYFQVKSGELVGRPSPVVQAFLDHQQEAHAVKQEWINVHRAKKFFAWRVYYADMMVRTLAESSHDV